MHHGVVFEAVNSGTCGPLSNQVASPRARSPADCISQKSSASNVLCPSWDSPMSFRYRELLLSRAFAMPLSPQCQRGGMRFLVAHARRHYRERSVGNQKRLGALRKRPLVFPGATRRMGSHAAALHGPHNPSLSNAACFCGIGSREIQSRYTGPPASEWGPSAVSSGSAFGRTCLINLLLGVASKSNWTLIFSRSASGRTIPAEGVGTLVLRRRSVLP